jgi:acetyl-CoA carboxylase carboxyl transferase subunit alpha
MVDRLLGRGRDDAARRDADTAPPLAPHDAVWARVQAARNVKRPHTIELVQAMADEFIELHGDRFFGDDPALVGGFARLDGRRVMVIGQQKGAETEENIRRNFGMPHPEGYRKAIRLMEVAERFRLPVITFVDVPGAHPGPESEERGIAEAIARSVGVMSRLRTPIVAVITGEGGSGGALAIAVGDVVIALENAVYSVISPEGCASILWRTPDEAPAAALAMKMTATEQQALGVVDIVVSEPSGGAQSDHAETARRLKVAIGEQLATLERRPLDALIEARYRRYRSMGAYSVVSQPAPPALERPGLTDRLRTLLGSARSGAGQISGQIPGPPSGRADEPPARGEV